MNTFHSYLKMKTSSCTHLIFMTIFFQMHDFFPEFLTAGPGPLPSKPDDTLAVTQSNLETSVLRLAKSLRSNFLVVYNRFKIHIFFILKMFVYILHIIISESKLLFLISCSLNMKQHCFGCLVTKKREKCQKVELWSQ